MSAIKEPAKEIEYEDSMFKCLAASFLISFFYVGSLYIWRTDLDRDHPETIKRRFLSAFLTLWISPPVAYFFGASKLLEKQPFSQVILTRLFISGNH
jgi:hypothetical protein